MHEPTTETPGAWAQGARETALCLILLLMGVLPFAVADNPWCGPASSLPWIRHVPPQATAGLLVFTAFSCLWARTVHWALPLAATLHGAVWVENVAQIHHAWHLPVLLAWLEATPALRRPWIRRLTVGGWHFHAAVAKLQVHGLGWADGESMRTWVEAFGYPHARAFSAYLPTWVLAAAQWFALIAEATAPAAAWRPRAVGFALLAFYVAVVVTFPFGFAGNAVLVGLYLLAPDEPVSAPPPCASLRG